MKKVEEFVPEVFLKLTSKTYPYGYEDVVAKEMLKLGLLPKETIKDVHGNYFIKIGESRTIFAFHLDTVSKAHVQVTHTFDGDIIKTDGTTTLGADDKAGVTVMTWMIRNKVPGLYYFFIGEEVGCIGSGLTAKNYEFDGEYDRIISFDRRGTDSVITHQSYSRCCSEVFANALCKELNKSGMSYKNDDGGVYTDSAEFVDLVSECTNISVGYYKEHTMQENQDIAHLVKLAKACVKVDWETLPTKRDKNVYEPKSYPDYTPPKTYYSHDYNKSKNVASSNRGKGTKSKGGWTRSGTTYNSGRDYGYDREYSYDSDYAEDEDGDYYFKTPGLKNANLSDYKEPTVYYDNGGSSLVELTNNKQYSWIIDKFSDRKLSYSELEIIREQYLDLENNDYDKYFYEHLVEEYFE